jgi:hypothetical protein
MGDTRTITAGQLADDLGISRQTMEKRVYRTFKGMSVGLSTPLSAEQIAKLSEPSGRKSAVVVREHLRNPIPDTTPTPKPAGDKKAPAVNPPVRPWYNTAALYFVLAATTATSVWNVLQVGFEIADAFTAVALTVVLSLAAVVFVWTGPLDRFTLWVVGLLLVYECGCNMIRIYGGLTNWHQGTPTNFLATVCDFFGTGTYLTARVIGAFTALVIVGVQYGAIFKINNSKSR